jgi:hypothetical protein
MHAPGTSPNARLVPLLARTFTGVREQCTTPRRVITSSRDSFFDTGAVKFCGDVFSRTTCNNYKECHGGAAFRDRSYGSKIVRPPIPSAKPSNSRRLEQAAAQHCCRDRLSSDQAKILQGRCEVGLSCCEAADAGMRGRAARCCEALMRGASLLRCGRVGVSGEARG